MTRRDNIIYYSITAAVFVLIIVFSILFHASGQPTNGNEENQLTALSIAVISALAALIGALAALIGAGAAVYVGTRKTRRDRMDELKVEMQELFTKDIVRQKYLEISEEEFFTHLKPEFKTQEYSTLHRCAYDELTYENKNRIVNSCIKHEQGMAALANVHRSRQTPPR